MPRCQRLTWGAPRRRVGAFFSWINGPRTRTLAQDVSKSTSHDTSGGGTDRSGATDSVRHPGSLQRTGVEHRRAGRRTPRAGAVVRGWATHVGRPRAEVAVRSVGGADERRRVVRNTPLVGPDGSRARCAAGVRDDHGADARGESRGRSRCRRNDELSLGRRELGCDCEAARDLLHHRRHGVALLLYPATAARAGAVRTAIAHSGAAVAHPSRTSSSTA